MVNMLQYNSDTLPFWMVNVLQYTTDTLAFFAGGHAAMHQWHIAVSDDRYATDTSQPFY